MKRPAATRFAILALLLACLGEALGFPFMRAFALRSAVVSPGVSSWFMTGFLLTARFLIAALILSFFEHELPSRSELSQGLWIGAFAGAGHVLQTDGLNWTDASTSAFLTQGYVLVIPIIVAIEDRRRPERHFVFAATLNLVGLAILARFDPRLLKLGRGETETLLAALLFAGQIFSISRSRYTKNRTGPVTLVMFLSIGLGAVPLAIATRRPLDLERLATSYELWTLLGLLTLLATLLPFVLMNRYQRHVSSSEAGVIYGAEPVLASVLALFLPELLSPIAGVAYTNEALSARLLAGAALVTTAALLLRARSSRSASPEM